MLGIALLSDEYGNLGKHFILTVYFVAVLEKEIRLEMIVVEILLACKYMYMYSLPCQKDFCRSSGKKFCAHQCVVECAGASRSQNACLIIIVMINIFMY